MRLHHFCLAALLLVFTTACNRDVRLQGKWNFDYDSTKAQFDQPKGDAAKGERKGIMDSLQGVQGLLATAQLKGSTLTITAKDMRLLDKNGTGDAEAYEIIERPEHDVWRVKIPSGKIETYTRQGDRLVTAPADASYLKLYFTRAQ